VAFLPMLEALTTRLISFPPMEPLRNGLLVIAGRVSGAALTTSGMVSVVGEWELALAFRPGPDPDPA
jgi:hypothetical protein